MIYYESGGSQIVLKICKCSGSVFSSTVIIALPCAAASSVLFLLYPDGSLSWFGGSSGGVLSETAPWAGFSFFVGFLIVFRTNQAYSRFWEGCVASYRMRSEWFDAISALIAFTKHSDAPMEDVRRFKELVVRLCSMLHAAALAELEAGDLKSTGELWANSYEIVDPAGVDTRSIESIKKCKMKTSLLFTWIQQVIAEHARTEILSIPPPILSRVFHELANGMVAFEDAMRIAYIPFPFPYAQACDTILLLHWLIAPIITSQWVTSALWAGIFCFTQVFILWSLNLIAIEIDHPFGKDSNDIDGERMQEELNSQLVLLLSQSTMRTPRLSSRWTPFLSMMEEKEEEEEEFFLARSTRGDTPRSHKSRFGGVVSEEVPETKRASTFGELFVRASHISFASTGTMSKAITDFRDRGSPRGGRPSSKASRTSCRISELDLSPAGTPDCAATGSFARSQKSGLGLSHTSLGSSHALSTVPSEKFQDQLSQHQNRLSTIASMQLSSTDLRSQSLQQLRERPAELVLRATSKDEFLHLATPPTNPTVLGLRASPYTPGSHSPLAPTDVTYCESLSQKASCPDCGLSLFPFGSSGLDSERRSATAKVDSIVRHACGKCKSRRDSDMYQACGNCESFFCRKCVDAVQTPNASDLTPTVPMYNVTRLPSPTRLPQAQTPRDAR